MKDKKQIIEKLLEIRKEEIIILELTEKHLSRKIIVGGKQKYELALGQIQAKLEEAKDFKTFLEWELENLKL